MNRTAFRNLALAVIAAIVLFGAVTVAAVSWVSVPVASAQGTSPLAAPLPRTITVVGDGTVNIKPDVARANIGVEVVRPTVEEATTENATMTAAVVAALKEQGIAEEDIQTSGYSVYAERYGNEGPLPDEEVRYRVTNTVNVLIRDLENVGQVLDTAVKAGANNIYGVEFLLDDPTAPRSAARKLAVENAQATAEELASLSGVKVGKIISISEVIGGNGGAYSNQFDQFTSARGGGAAAPPIQPGELRLTMQLQVTYELLE